MCLVIVCVHLGRVYHVAECNEMCLWYLLKTVCHLLMIGEGVGMDSYSSDR